MSRKFRLLDLPFVPKQQILQNFTFADLIDFSLCSKKCKNAVQSMKTIHNRIELSINSFFLHVYLKSDEELIASWAVGSFSMCGSKQFRKINGRRMKILKTRNNNIYSKCSNNPLSFQKVAEFLINLFPRSLINLDIRADNITNLRVMMPRINRYHDVKIEKNDGVPIPSDDLKALLENVVITGDIDLRIRISPDFQCPSVRFQCNKWQLYGNAHWITREMLLSSHCSEIILSNAISLKPSDFLEFVENWKRSSDKKLKFAIFRGIGGKFPIEPLDFEHLEPKKWDPVIRGQSYPYMPKFAADLSDGIDILRSDGLIATIRRTVGTLEFYIWHDRFPNVDGLHVD